jgi:probable addiction module antidote protein
MPRARPFNAAKYRDDPRAIAKYLNNALSTGDPVQLTKAIDDMVRAQGVARVSRKSGIERTRLYRAFRGKANPTIGTIFNVLIGLDIQLMAKPSAGF